MLREIGWVGMDWIDYFWDRDQWRAFMNKVMDLQVTYNVGKFLKMRSDCWLLKKDLTVWSYYCK
jgi:hypothetical protein